MQLTLSTIQEPFEWDETVRLDVEALERDDLHEVGPVEVGGRIESVHPGFHLRLRLAWDQTLFCTRCLEPIEQRADAESRLLVLGEEADRGSEELEEEMELGAEDLGVLLVEGDELDTDPIVIEAVQLEVPMKVLCREDCAGLCPQCGTDLNQGSCECEPARDPRWDALADLSTSG